ncbi:MAG: glycosyltransferase family 9 protein, partial [Fimbriimonas sp.]
MRSEKVLVSMKRFIGDAVMTTPMLNALQSHHPDITIICPGHVAQVLWHPDFERKFLPLDTKRKPWELVAKALELRKQRFTLAVLVNHSFRSALTTKLAGIPKRVGHATEGRNWLLTSAVPYDENTFEAWSELDLLKPLAIEPQRTTPVLPVTESERAKGEELLKGAMIGIQPGARFASKMLTVEVLAEVANQLSQKPAFFGASEEKDSADKLQAAVSKDVTNLVGVTSIRESLGALANLKAMIGADTGLMHMATAVGCPTVTIFGPTPAQKWGHTYGSNQVILAPEGD